MNSYSFLAGCYDKLTTDVDYAAWADYLEGHFKRVGLPGDIILDLGCGTGSLTRQLAERGYEMIGVDLSPDMLMEAMDKCGDMAGTPPLFLCQSMDKLDLYGTIDGCVSCLDSINYVTDPEKLKKAFQRVHLFLMTGGLFIFDVNTVEKFAQMDGQMYLDETEDTYCVWRTSYDGDSRLCEHAMDIFQRRKNGLWERGEELHQERGYTLEELTQYLQEAGFEEIARYGQLSQNPPEEGEQRVFFVARKTAATLSE